MAKPVFVISLDLELGWGFIAHPEHKALRLLNNDPQCGRGVAKLLLNLLQRYNIPASWAVVGHLFLNQGEGKRWISKDLPQFKDGWVNWDFYCQICSSPLYSAPDIINEILASPVTHEIGLHSFFHIPFSLCNQEAARLEVELGVNLMRKWGFAPQSFVFPGNFIGHIDALKGQGIKIYRGNDAKLCKKTAPLLIRKASGAIGKLIALPVLPLWKEDIWEIPGSMSFYDPFVPFTLLSRAKTGLRRTIRTNKVFHIWLHPWSLLLSKGLLQDLETFLAIVSQKRDEGTLKVMTMGDLASCLNQNRGNHNVSR